MYYIKLWCIQQPHRRNLHGSVAESDPDLHICYKKSNQLLGNPEHLQGKKIIVLQRDRDTGRSWILFNLNNRAHNTQTARLSKIRHEDFRTASCVLRPVFVMLRPPPLNLEMGWTGDFWSNWVFLILHNKGGGIFCFKKTHIFFFFQSYQGYYRTQKMA